MLTKNKKASMSQSVHPPPIDLTKASSRSLRPRSFISAALAGEFGRKIGKHLLRSVSATLAASCTFYCRKIFSSPEYMGLCRGPTLLFVTEGCMHWVIPVASEDPNQSFRLDPADFLRIRKIRAIRHQKSPEYGWILLFLRQRQLCVPCARGGYYMSYLEQDMLVWTLPLSAASAY
jgi:hypothetical protein